MKVSPYWHTSNSVVKISGILELIHGDLMGTMRVKSKGGARYVFVLVDDVMSEAFEMFKKYTAFMEAHLSCRIKIIRTDNGSEFCNKKFKQFCYSHGILHQTSHPTPLS
ncbi:hypothetical protein PsorP6_016602 [Peronosclerospora sorghi]|uniref:Uncharacterized protein n=1 Tax=Peronosclerospora sorghi TaxID=230839 RepID=A0ACC0VJ20_9STRA|nr:hypothetical protein PsorP6_016602 [Peronosclerospora sorghi]